LGVYVCSPWGGVCVWQSSSSPEIQGVVHAAGGVCVPGNLVSSLSCFFLVSGDRRGSVSRLDTNNWYHELGVLGVPAMPEAWQRWRRSPAAARRSSGPCVSPWRWAVLWLSWRVAEAAGGDVVCAATAEAAEALRGGVTAQHAVAAWRHCMAAW
uniref:Uncharacterized protein n=1 Tax=Triticum urartu TaxID=4572 RepID=A0A8R7R392_TRIUA